jgi:UDP-N-acetylmuramoylalanine-D-glutamate ligase
MLEDACPSCDIAIISNLYHEHHAIRHGSVEAYHKAKWNITNHAKNILIGSQIQHIPSTVHPYTKFGGDETYGVRSEGIYHKNHKIINLTDIKLLGNHNYYNICAVVGVCDILGIETKHLISELRLFH